MIEMFGVSLGTVFQLLTTIFSGGILAVLTLFVRRELGLKKLEVEAEQVKVNARQVENADSADQRDHIAEEMKALRDNVDRLRHELHDCEEDCRKQVRELQDELLGEKRQRVAEQISLINIFIDIADEPTRKRLMAALDSIQRVKP